MQMNKYLRCKISDELTFSNISDGIAVLWVEKRLRKAWLGWPSELAENLKFSLILVPFLKGQGLYNVVIFLNVLTLIGHENEKKVPWIRRQCLFIHLFIYYDG